MGDVEEIFYESYSRSHNQFYLWGRETGAKFWVDDPDCPDIPNELIVRYGARADQERWAYYLPEQAPPPYLWAPINPGVQHGEENEFLPIGSAETPEKEIPDDVASIGDCIPAVREASLRNMAEGDRFRAFMDSIKRPREGSSTAEGSETAEASRTAEGPIPDLAPRGGRKGRRRGRWWIAGMVGGLVLALGSKILR